jgi:hypothetical protein
LILSHRKPTRRMELLGKLNSRQIELAFLLD